MKTWLKAGLLGLVMTVTLAAARPQAIAQTPPIIEALNLTPEQQQQVRAIVAARRSDISAILTPEQQRQFRQAYQELRDFQEAIRTIDTLTDPQKADLREVLQGSRDDLRQVLTAEQIAQLRSQLEQRRSPQP